MKSPVSKTDLNLWLAFVDEAKTHRLYSAFALQAMSEGHPEVAEAFMEAAGAEIVHAMAHLNALGAVKSSVENLRQVVEEEAIESRVIYPRYILEAEADGRQDAVSAFRLALDREEHHIHLFKSALDRLNAKIDSGARRAADEQARFFGRLGTDERERRPQMARTAHGVEKMSGPAEIWEERARIVSRSRIREVVFGAQDGILTTAGVVSSIYGASQSNGVILLAGLASAFAGMVAMTAGSYISSKAEGDFAKSEIAREMREIKERPAEELAELVEIYKRQGMGATLARDAALEVARDPRKMLAVKAREELGLDTDTASSALKDAMVMAPSFLIGAAVPIVPYTIMHGTTALIASVLSAAVALFGIGVVKARASATDPWRSGIEAFAIGASAALLGYIIGTLIPHALGISVPGA